MRVYFIGSCWNDSENGSRDCFFSAPRVLVIPLEPRKNRSLSVYVLGSRVLIHLTRLKPLLNIFECDVNQQINYPHPEKKTTSKVLNTTHEDIYDDEKARCCRECRWSSARWARSARFGPGQILVLLQARARRRLLTTWSWRTVNICPEKERYGAILNKYCRNEYNENF